MSSFAHAALLFSATALSCQSSAQSLPTSEIVVDAVTRCSAPRAATQAPDLPLDDHHRSFFTAHPLAQLQNMGGRTIKSPRIVAVYFGADEMEHATDALLQSYGCTSYWRDAVGEYGVGDALYERSVTLPAFPASIADGTTSFDAWIRDGIEANSFGAITEDDLLLFFVPPGTHVASDDCIDRTGGHTSLVTSDGRNVAYAYFVSCVTSWGPVAELAERTHAVTHEITEMATDPFPAMAPAWRKLGAGVLASSVRESATGIDDEGADYCNDVTVDAPDYPFAIAANYSNRRARGGMDPCVPASPITALAELHDGAAIDLSSGHARVVLDVFAEDRAATFDLYASASFSAGQEGLSLGLLDRASPLVVRDGDSIAVNLQLALPSRFPGTPVPLTQSEVVIALCRNDADAASTCTNSRIPMSGRPPIGAPPDAGILEDAADGDVGDGVDGGGAD